MTPNLQTYQYNLQQLNQTQAQPYAMAEQPRKHSALIQQLCRHIANLQQTNARLQEQLVSNDNQKELVCRALGCGSWDELLTRVKETKQAGFEDTSTSYKNAHCSDRHVSELSKFAVAETPLRHKDVASNSALESPIESESRIINKGIRGDTDRSHSPQDSSFMPGNAVTKSGHVTLADLAQHSYSKETLHLGASEEENMLLSIENTKLRQRVSKLEAIVASRHYY